MSIRNSKLAIHPFLLLVLAPVSFGAALGAEASRALWNYAWSPPRVDVGEAGSPVAFAIFSVDGHLGVLSRIERDATLQRELYRCDTGGNCTYGRPLTRWGLDELSSLPLASSEQIRRALKVAAADQPAEAARALPVERGAVVVFDRAFTLLAAETGEIADDRFMYRELLVESEEGLPRAVAEARYYFDVAGIEFATPFFLMGSCIVATYLVLGGAWVSWRLVGSVRRWGKAEST